ncbi:MAG: ABC transporter permease, partial [Victivallaceae bacterium]
MSKKPSVIFASPHPRRKRNFLLFSGTIILTVLVLYAFLSPFFLPSYERTDLKLTLAPASLKHPFGTDCLGRDLCARVALGIRISLIVALAAAITDFVIGVCFGGLCVLLGKTYDNILTRFMDILYSIPRILLIILFMLALPPGIASLIIAISITGWIPLAKIVRGRFLSLGNKSFVLSAKTMGANKRHILLRHFLPNAQASVLSSLILTIPSSIYTEA